jgi:hypothetical protein
MEGQWFGELDGQARGPIFVNIDESQKSKRGSIIVDDKIPDSLPFIAFLTIQDIKPNQIRARVHDFIFFKNDVPILCCAQHNMHYVEYHIMLSRVRNLFVFKPPARIYST